MKGIRSVKMVAFGAGERGFTLLELLVALTIFAIISAALHGSLVSMIDTRQQLEDASNNLREIQTALRIIERDVMQSVDRPIRTRYEPEMPAMLGYDAPVSLELTINGRRNPAWLQRSSLQRVAYRLEDEQLIKDVWPVLDRDVDVKPFSQVILRGVRNFEVVFVGADDQIFPTWPPNDGSSETIDPGLPRALHLYLDVASWGAIDRLLVI